MSTSAPPRTDPSQVLSDLDAAKMLGDTQYVLYAARVAAKLFWGLICKKYPELRGLR